VKKDLSNIFIPAVLIIAKGTTQLIVSLTHNHDLKLVKKTA